jgi:hypothetical protein
MLDPGTLFVLTTLVDCAAVGALWWMMDRAARERAIALAEQRDTLERLRADLGELVAEAERRTESVEGSLAAREARLRVLLDDLSRVEGGARDAVRLAPAAPLAASDPAEARLRQALEASFERR